MILYPTAISAHEFYAHTQNSKRIINIQFIDFNHYWFDWCWITLPINITRKIYMARIWFGSMNFTEKTNLEFWKTNRDEKKKRKLKIS